MPIERETIVETEPEERETVVADGGNPFGMIVGIILFILAIILAFWLVGAFFPGGGGGEGSVSVDLPEATVTE